MANLYNTMPYIPYKILMGLFPNENIWKLLKYNTADCLSLDNLTQEEKVGMIWNGKNEMENCNVFLVNTKSDIMTTTKSILMIYRQLTTPTNKAVGDVFYEFDFLFGSESAMVDYNGVPCNRGDVFETELLQSLNEKDVAGVGNLQYNMRCSSRTGTGNKNTYSGIAITMTTIVGGNSNGCS